MLDLDPDETNLLLESYDESPVKSIATPVVVLDSRANHTLSQINETYDEDDLSNWISKPISPNAVIRQQPQQNLPSPDKNKNKSTMK
jgi:hypothetical protein